MNLGDRDQRVGDEAGGGVAFVRIEELDQMVRDPRAGERIRRSRSDGHAAIDLTRVRADDFGVEPFRQGERQHALARRRWTGEHEYAGHHIRLKSRAMRSGLSRTIVGRPCGQCIGFSQRCSRSTRPVISA